jgi:hypothetical protein
MAPADVYFGRQAIILARRERINPQTLGRRTARELSDVASCGLFAQKRFLEKAQNSLIYSDDVQSLRNVQHHDHEW